MEAFPRVARNPPPTGRHYPAPGYIFIIADVEVMNDLSRRHLDAIVGEAHLTLLPPNAARLDFLLTGTRRGGMVPGPTA